MIQQQVEQFTSSLQNIAAEYSNPAVILQHMPVLKDNEFLQQNPEYLGYGLGGLIGLFVLKKMIFKRRKETVSKVSMIMPKPYEPEEHEMQPERPLRAPRAERPAKVEIQEPVNDEIDERLSMMAAPRQVHLQEPEVRGPALQLEDVTAVTFAKRAVMTPDEARARVMVQAVLHEYGAGYMIMARTSLAALLTPGQDAVGPSRANAISAIQDKYVDFGVYDRAGRCILALDINSSQPELGKKALERAVVHSALNQANIPHIQLSAQDKAAHVRMKLTPHLKAVARASAEPVVPLRKAAAQQPEPVAPSKPARPQRPIRPVRPTRGAAAR